MRLLLYFALFINYVGCSTTKDIKVTVRDGLFYDQNSKKLLSGKVTIPGGFFDDIEGESKGRLKNGKKTGLWKFYHSNGKLKEESHWNNDIKNGPSTEFFESGNKMLDANIINGKKSGLCTEWFENGQIKNERNFKNDKLEGLSKFWHKNGVLEFEFNHTDGKFNGLCRRWNENGVKIEEFYTKDDKHDGSFTEWYPSGSKKGESVWEDGKLISYSVWKPNGEKCNRTKIRNGDGVVVRYSEEGHVVAKTHFKNGKELAF
jgi:antitoxin component YwqK of YwqJK toxin-antitoxin module